MEQDLCRIAEICKNITANKIKMRYGFWLYRIFYYGNSCSSRKDSMGFFSVFIEKIQGMQGRE